MKKVLAFAICIMIVVSSCGYRLGSHGSKVNVPAWKAEKEAKKQEKEIKRDAVEGIVKNP